jgi:3-mercaptopyruvate sulfurtransferase SseA
MIRIAHYPLLLALAGTLISAQPAAPADGIRGNVVGAAWLEEHRGDADVLILDASPAQIYKARHVPGAIGVDLFSWYGIQERTVDEMQQLYQSWGVSPAKTIVMYDQGGTFLATRLFYQLHYHGYPTAKLFVLDGGLSKWLESGFAVTNAVTPAPPKGSFTVTTVNESVRARLPEMLTASGDRSGSALVDALGPDWHYGEVAPFDRPGHIPNGVLLPSADFFNADKTFKSADEITRMLKHVGIRPEQQVYSYCGGGVAASVPFFALKFLANYPNVKLYKESEMGWLADDRGLPYWTYDAPFQIREATWLQFWAGARIRAFGGTQVSILDVRPAATFDEGHVPFAVNIPAAMFRSHLDDPAAIAAALTAAGVDPSQEAVVISGGGVTTDAALAFAMLDQLGHTKVSLFLESMDRWTARGFELKKERAAPTAPALMSPTPYAAGRGKDVIVGDGENATGLYPTIFIASGKAAPARAPTGTVVHVPYTDLLDADGMPKPAKDIWNILAKAGVSRYAELVCVSDDPGEAAANYFILKLMGFPDVKIQSTR